MKIGVSFLVGVAGGAGIGLAMSGNPSFILLTIPAILYIGWGLYLLWHN